MEDRELEGRAFQYGPSNISMCMPYRKEEFINNNVYHIILRALDDNLIFKSDNDYYRGIFSVYEFNNGNPVDIWLRRKQRKREKLPTGLEGPSFQIPQRDLLVDVLAFCFMPNHIHLLLRQTSRNGITRFMRKVGTGYATYFNKKYQRKGYVFQNRFLSVYVKDDNQLQIVFNYIHANPASLVEPNFKDAGIKNPKKVINFIEKYKWSSYQDYLGIKNFPSVTEREFMKEVVGNEQGCREMLEGWIMHKEKLSQFKDLFLE